MRLNNAALENWQIKILNETEKEYKQSSKLHQEIKYVCFVSKSKGRRYRKDGSWSRRLRRRWIEVELINYRNTGWHSWNKFPFDEVATELYGKYYSDGLEVDATRALMEDVKRCKV